MPKFIMLLGLIKILYHLPYRQLEGFIRALVKYVEGLQALYNMQKNKQAQHKPRRNFAQIQTSKPSSRFIRHKSAQWRD